MLGVSRSSNQGKSTNDATGSTNISPTTLADILGREQVTDIATALCCLSRNGVAG